MISDVSDGVINTEDPRPLRGYAAYGRSMRDALEPLVGSFGIDLFDDGSSLRCPASSTTLPIGLGDLGNSADGKTVSGIERTQASARSLPASLRLTYYDPSRDYQTGESRASIGEVGMETQSDLPAVFNASEAKGLANEMLARVWATRDRLVLRLPTANIECEPGAILTLPFAPSRWQVQSVTIEAFVTIVELRPATNALAAITADGGRVAPNVDAIAGPLTLALFDVPDPNSVATKPMLLLAASSPGEGWKPRKVDVQIGQRRESVQTARSKSVLGHVLGALGEGTASLLDDVNSIDIQLVDTEQWLTSCDTDALNAGANAAVLGKELFQFGRAESQGGGRFRLSRLLRGRAGTESACGNHAADEAFCLLQPGSVQPLSASSTEIGIDVGATSGSQESTLLLQGEALRPLTPIGLSALVQDGGDVLLTWTRRSRAGFAWLDGIDAPLGEARELYRIVLTSNSGSVELSASEPRLQIDLGTVASLGAGPVSVSVQQTGDYAASRPAQIIID